MLQRLFVLLLLVVATVAVSTPARASTLTVSDVMCGSSGSTFTCEAYLSGGTGTYTSFRWGVATGPNTMYYYTSEPRFSQRCMNGIHYAVNFRVTDSAGATASGVDSFTCRSAWN